MPPDGYSTITVPDGVFERVTEVMIEYECDSIADAVDTASAVALERDEAALAQFLGRVSKSFRTHAFLSLVAG